VISAPFQLSIKNIFKFLPVLAYWQTKKIVLNSALLKYNAVKLASYPYFAF